MAAVAQSASTKPRRGGRDQQEETDCYWNAIVGNGGQESHCGWCKKKIDAAAIEAAVQVDA
jgi:hypothetical protein